MIYYPIDVITPVAPGDTIYVTVTGSLINQPGVLLKHFIVEGPAPEPGEDRYSVIARSRNLAKLRGTAPLVLFLDNDVLIAPGALAALAKTLTESPGLGVLGLCYLHSEDLSKRPCAHVAMGATLWKREVLEKITFRTDDRGCECRYACEDVRRLGYGIDYPIQDEAGKYAIHIRDCQTYPAPAAKAPEGGDESTSK